MLSPFVLVIIVILILLSGRWVSHTTWFLIAFRNTCLCFLFPLLKMVVVVWNFYYVAQFIFFTLYCNCICLAVFVYIIHRDNNRHVVECSFLFCTIMPEFSLQRLACTPSIDLTRLLYLKSVHVVSDFSFSRFHSNSLSWACLQQSPAWASYWWWWCPRGVLTVLPGATLTLQTAPVTILPQSCTITTDIPTISAVPSAILDVLTLLRIFLKPKRNVRMFASKVYKLYL